MLPRKAILLGSVAVLAVFSARPLRRALSPGVHDKCVTRTFDARAWSSSPEDRSPATPRLCMVDDLLRRHALVGWTRAQVVALLGRPTETTYFRDYALVYYLGPEGGLAGVDSKWLLVQVDSSGQVSKRLVATD